MAAPLRVWIEAARLRTLPLAFASILLGSLLAEGRGLFRADILALALLTTLALQVLSNYANDLGDTLHGADHAGRQGPQRAVQQGTISAGQMRRAVVITSVVALGAGIGLLWVAFTDWAQLLTFLGLGLLCIAAAILYTNGKRPYGYAGLGDISVFVFFGWVGVLGTYTLYGARLEAQVGWAAVSAGLLATGVLNINNLRDVISDKAAGKYSIPVRLGYAGGKRYHACLVGGALIANLLFTASAPGHSPYLYLWMIPAIGLVCHAISIYKLATPAEADPYLKQLALMALASDLALGLGYVLAQRYPAGLGF